MFVKIVLKQIYMVPYFWKNCCENARQFSLLSKNVGTSKRLSRLFQSLEIITVTIGCEILTLALSKELNQLSISSAAAVLEILLFKVFLKQFDSVLKEIRSTVLILTSNFLYTIILKQINLLH